MRSLNKCNCENAFSFLNVSFHEQIYHFKWNFLCFNKGLKCRARLHIISGNLFTKLWQQTFLSMLIAVDGISSIWTSKIRLRRYVWLCNVTTDVWILFSCSEKIIVYITPDSECDVFEWITSTERIFQLFGLFGTLACSGKKRILGLNELC